MSGTDSQDTEARVRLLVAFLSLVYSAWMIWMLIPQHHRQLCQMRILAMGRATARKCARHAGVAAMHAELATAQQNYTLPYSLSVLGDWLGHLYDKTRNVQ